MRNILTQGSRDIGLHSLGTDISKATTVAEALTIARADYKVGRCSLYSRTAVPGTNMPPAIDNTCLYKIPDANGVFRLKDDKPASFISTVGPSWTPIQNSEAFEAAGILAGHGATFDRAYVSENSAQVYLRMKLEGMDRKKLQVLGDECGAYVIMTNRHDGSGAFRMVLQILRLTCTNGMTRLIPSKAVYRRHTSGIVNTVEDIRRMVAASERTAEQMMEDIAKTANQLVNIHFTERRFRGMVDELLPHPAGAVSKAVEEQRSRLYTYLNKEDLANFRDSGWAAVMAVSDFSSHLGDRSRGLHSDQAVALSVERAVKDDLLTQALAYVLAAN